MEQLYVIKNKKYTIGEFMTKFNISDETKATAVIDLLIRQGKAEVYSNNTKEEDLMEKTAKSLEFERLIAALEQEEAEAKEAIREKNTEDVDLVNLSLDFSSTQQAVNYEDYANDLGIKDTEIVCKKGLITLRLAGITPQEYSKITMRYQADKAINSTVNFTKTAVIGATDAVNYGATNIVAPVAKIAGEAGLNLGKGLVQTGVKVGAGLVNSGAKAVKDTRHALGTDPEMLKARQELTNTKNDILRFFRKKAGINRKGSGIGSF